MLESVKNLVENLQRPFLLFCFGDRLKNSFEDLFFGDRQKNFLEDLFFWRTLAPVSLVFGLGLEHSCPWFREGLSSEGLFLALALVSDFFVSLAVASTLVSSTAPQSSIYKQVNHKILQYNKTHKA